jgi:putative phosphoribosyl transferase
MAKYVWERPFYKDREEAAGLLAEKLGEYKGGDPLVLAVPRGAVPMGRILAERLGGELDVVLVRKVGAPDEPELALGAVGEGGELYLAPHATALHYPEEAIEREAQKQVRLLQERRRLYTPFRPAVDPHGRDVIVVDDGIATGSTMMAALHWLQRQTPRRIIVATAVIPPDVLEKLRGEVHEVVALTVTRDFGAVSEFFQEFPQVSDAEVVRILKEQQGSRTRKG